MRGHLVRLNLPPSPLLLLAAVLAACSPANDLAQPDHVVRLSAEPQCPACVVELTQELAIGRGDTVLNWPQSVVRDSRGRYYFAQPNEAVPPAVYGPDGSYLGRIGGTGDGPGEMRHAAFLAVGDGDTLFVVDWVSRLLVFGPDGDFIRQGYFPGSGWGIIHLSDGSIVRNGDMFTGELSGRTFGRFTPLGDLSATLGDSIPRTPTTPAHIQIRSMWADDSAGFWAGTKYGRYTLDHWTAAGLAARYQIERDWFRTVSPEDELGLEMNAADGVVGGAIDSAGRLWVYVRVADPRRDQARSVTLSGLEGSYQTPEDWDQVFDTVIEVFDAQTMALLASHRVDDYIRVVLGADRVMKIAEEDPGGLVATVYRVQLKEP